MNLSKLSVRRPVTVLMITFIIILLGSVSLSRLPIDLLPKIEIPVAIVSTSYSGVGPEEIEKMITQPVEEALATVNDIKNIESISSEGNSLVAVEFNFGIDMDFASLEMREKIDMIKGFLPEDASDPMVLKIDPNALPIVQLSLSGSTDLASMQTIAEETIKPRIERLDGVASVDISGGYSNQIEIKANQEKLKGYGISLSQLAQIIGYENLNLPGGQVKNGQQELSIRTVGEFKSLDEIRNLPLSLPTGGIIRLSDVAEVEFSHKELSTISKTNGVESINISIQKQSGMNTVKIADKVNDEIDKLRKEFPSLNMEVVMDQSEYIERAVENVFQSAIIGAILAVVILYLFLRNVRTTLIIGTSIPISIIATFILLYFSDITLNLMTLGGLALGVGMLVDNSIVVLENIYRFREEGRSKTEAATLGASEVSMAVTASTLTTIAVFLPIVFVEGITSTIFKELAMTVTLSLAVSLFVSLTLIPMLSSQILKMENKEKRKSRINKASENIFSKLDNRYRKILSWSLSHRKSTVAIALSVFIVSMASIVTVGAEFFPTMDEGQLIVDISLPEGSELNNTNDVVEEVEEKLEEIEEVKIVFSSVGSDSVGSFNSKSGSDKASVTVMLKDLDQRERSTSEIADQVRDMVKDIPGAEIEVTTASNTMMGLGGDPVSISIKGDDLEELKEISYDFKDIIESVEGTREVKTNISEGIPEVQIKVNRDSASKYGLTAGQIASSVKGVMSGITASRYKYNGDEIDIVVKGNEALSESISSLKLVSIDTPLGVSVPLSQVADVVIERGPSKIYRQGQVRTVTVSSQIIGRDLQSVSNDILAKLDDYQMPQGYEYTVGGQNEQLQEAFGDLSLALILAVVLVFMILASQFESLLHPLTIMLSVPLAYSGGVLGLVISRIPLSVPGIIGAIILTGIVVNNAIVLVDYINTLRRSGMERNDAIIKAGPIRLRPILMTALTTILGLLPLAIGTGEGSEVQAPMAIVVIGGLILSTLLTLIFIPVMYTFIDDLANSIKRKFMKGA